MTELIKAFSDNNNDKDKNLNIMKTTVEQQQNKQQHEQQKHCEQNEHDYVKQPISESTTTTAIRKSRAQVKQSVAQNWAVRRSSLTKQNNINHVHDDDESTVNSSSLSTSISTHNISSSSRRKQQQPPKVSSPPFFPCPCVYIKNAWKQQQQQQQRRQLRQQQQSDIKEEEPEVVDNRSSQYYRNNVENHIKQLYIKKAISQQVEETLNSKQQLLIDVLPSEYDNIEKAVSIISQKHKRVFMLLDLSSIVTSYIQLKKDIESCLSIIKKKKKSHNGANTNVRHHSVAVQIINYELQYTAQYNYDSSLLDLLCRLGIPLRCSSIYDIKLARKAIERNSERRHHEQHQQPQNQAFATTSDASKIIDNLSKTRKPDGYIRHLLNVIDSSISNASTSSTTTEAISSDYSLVLLAVDGPEEVHRICNTIKRINERRERQQGNPHLYCNNNNNNTRFILRLPSKSTTNKKQEDSKTSTNLTLKEEWKALIDTTYDAALQNHSSLNGFSIDLGQYYVNNNITATANEDEEASDCSSSSRIDILGEILIETCQYLLYEKKKMTNQSKDENINECIQIDLTGLYPPSSPSSSTSSSFNNTTANTSTAASSSSSSSSDLCKLLTALGSSSSIMNKSNNVMMKIKVTIDVSHLLVAHAGALCTRIIGVKHSYSSTFDSSLSSLKSDIHNNHDNENDIIATTTTITKTSTTESCKNPREQQQEEDKDKEVDIHYYIDDGCYGSLQKLSQCGGSGVGDSNGGCSNKASPTEIFKPMPLYQQQQQQQQSDSATDNNGKQQQTQQEEDQLVLLYNSTVWGPTCDGLDRVCRSVQLPMLNVDDWLVFPNLGCSLGLGTSFNGFDPPDTVYCVLGYFRQV